MNAFLLTMLMLPAADPVPQDTELVKALLQVSLKHAEDYAIHPAGDEKAVFTMLPQAVFRHSQPVRGDDIGAVYLWVDADQRPALIGTTFAYTVEADRRRVVHEFHSLANGPLTAEWRGKTPWQPKTAGLEWKPVPNAPPADAKPTVRTRQVRDIARRFSANSVDEYAAASFTDFALSLQLDNKEVWTAGRRSTGPSLPHWADGVGTERLPTK